jgi:transglutaminase-like putative cysteine protease
MIARLARGIFTAEALGLILVLTALQTLTYGIAFSLQATETGYFFYLCLLAALTGLGLSKKRLSGIQASVGIAALGVLGVWITGASLAPALLDLGKSILFLIPQIIPSIQSHISMDTSRVAEAWSAIVQSSSVLALRAGQWTAGLSRNVIVNDALMHNLAWMLILWLVSAWIGWFTERRNAVTALMPGLALLAAVTSYSARKIETVWLMVFILLLLMGVWNYRNQTQQWEKRKVDYSDSIRYDASQAVLFLSIVISTFAFITPSISWREIRDYLREKEQSSGNEAAEVLGIREEQIPAEPAPIQKSALPREHLLSGGYANSQKIVMTIRTGELPSIPVTSFEVNAPRYYWRSVIYDVYTGAGWATSRTSSQNIQANTPLIPGLLSGYKPLHLDVRMAEPEGTLFWSGMLFSADVPITTDWRVRPASNLFADQTSLLQADIFAALTTADSYRAESYLPNVPIADLRASPAIYPEEIARRYLPLPKSVPERVGQLAQEITAGMDTPYEKAQAIEEYLRANYPYDLEISAPPEDADVADYFLFELKRGYCDYYATAMVVLARSSGLPARFVSGYAPGAYDASNAQYIVREMDAHSWAEVYFPGIGWVEFEPTASQPEIERMEEEVPQPADQSDDSIASALLRRFRLQRVSMWGLPLAAFALLILLYFTVIEHWYYMRLAPATAIERMYRGFYRAGRLLAGERTQAETAHEFMDKVIGRLNAMKEKSRLAKAYMNAQSNVLVLTDLYHSSLFSRQQTQKDDTSAALKTWKQLRWQLILARVIISLRAARLSSVHSTHRDPAP